MVNTNVFRGSDADLVFVPTNASNGESQIANDTMIFYDLIPVGRATNVEVFVQTDLKRFHEIGKRHPAVLRPGNINISGRIGRAFINGALLKMLLGKGADVTREAEPYPQPTFSLLLYLNDPSVRDKSITLTVHFVKLENWAYSLPEDDFVMESVTFKGLFISVDDREG